MPDNPFREAINSRKKPNEPKAPSNEEKVAPKRGRPKTGKSSSDGYVSRTFYIKEETDLDVEELLVKLKRKGVKLDKSELVEILLASFVDWHNGENLESLLAEISPS